MDIDDNQIEVQLEKMEIGEASGAASLLEQRTKAVKQTRSEIDEAFTILNDEIDSLSILPALKAHFTTKLGERYMQIDSFIDLRNALLELENGNYKVVIIQLYESLKDNAEQIAGQIEDLYNKYKEQRSRIGDDRPLFGRDDELNTLKKHLQTQETRVINVCGLAGIGKSQIVKQLVWMLDDCTYYADCRGVTECSQIISKLLADIGKSGIGSPEDLKSALLSELKNRGETTLIVIDDITGLTEKEKTEGWLNQTSAGKSEKIELLELIQVVLKPNDKVKVIITSQEAMKITDKSDDENREIKIMGKFNDCWVDMKLDRISNYSDCLKIVAPGQEHISRELETLINKCHGHPYSLNLLMTYVQGMGGVMGGVNALINQEELLEGTQLSFKKLFMNVFNKLNSNQILILETLSMFPNEVTVRDLYETHYLDTPSDRQVTIEHFYEKLTTDFSSNFLIEFVKSGFEGKIPSRLVKCYHPSVRFHVENQLLQDESKHITTVSRFVKYHIRLMADLGKKCIHSKRYASNDVYTSSVSISQTLRYLDRTPFCDLLFETLNSNTPLLIHLIIFLDNYHDLFTRPMAGLFERLRNIMSTTSDVHLYLLTVFISRKKQNYQTMKDLLSPQQRRVTQYDPILNLLMRYSDGFFHLNAPWLLESRKSVEEGMAFLKEAAKFMKTVTDKRYQSAVKYFESMILLDISSGYFTRSFIDRDNQLAHLKQAMSLTIKSERCMIEEKIYILRARMLEYKGLFMSVQGDNDTNYESACKSYGEASKYYNDTLEELKRLNLGYSKQAGKVMYRQVTLLVSHSTWISEQKTRTSQLQKQMIGLLHTSIRVAKEALSIFKNFGTDSLKERIRTEVCIAKTYDRCLVEERGLATSKQREFYQKQVLKHLTSSYNIMKNNRRSCNLSKQLPALNTVHEMLPKIMSWTQHPVEKIDKVKLTMEKIKREVEKDAGELSSPSGSDLSNHSDLWSDPEDRVEIVTEPQPSTSKQKVKLTEQSKTYISRKNTAPSELEQPKKRRIN